MIGATWSEQQAWVSKVLRKEESVVLVHVEKGKVEEVHQEVVLPVVSELAPLGL